MINREDVDATRVKIQNDFNEILYTPWNTSALKYLNFATEIGDFYKKISCCKDMLEIQKAFCTDCMCYIKTIRYIESDPSNILILLNKTALLFSSDTTLKSLFDEEYDHAVKTVRGEIKVFPNISRVEAKISDVLLASKESRSFQITDLFTELKKYDVSNLCNYSKEESIEYRRVATYRLRNCAVELALKNHDFENGLTILDSLILYNTKDQLDDLAEQLQKDKKELLNRANFTSSKQRNVKDKSVLKNIVRICSSCCLVLIILYGILYANNSFQKNYAESQKPTPTPDPTPKIIKIYLEPEGGETKTPYVTFEAGDPLPTALAPKRPGFRFEGYYSEPEGKGELYYDKYMNSVCPHDVTSNRALFAYWIEKPEVPYNDSRSDGDPVYVDIVSIYPEECIYYYYEHSDSDFYVNGTITSFICRCKSKTSGEVWVKIAAEKYKELFDPDINLEVHQKNEYRVANEIFFSSPRRWHGLIIEDEDSDFTAYSRGSMKKIYKFISFKGIDS